MSPRRQHLIAALPRSGTSARTHAASVRAVRLLAQCSHTSPDRMTAQERQRSCLHRTNGAGLAPASRRLCSRGLRFFSPHVLTRDGHTLSLWRAPTPPRLPAVRRLRRAGGSCQAATPWHHQGSCPTVSRWGLRLPAALCLPVSASAGQRLQGHGPPWPGRPRSLRPPARRDPRAAPPLLANPSSPPLAFARHGAGAPPSPPAAFPLRRARVQGACRTAHTPGREHHTGRRSPSPAACLCAPSARSRCHPPTPPALPGTSPPRHHEALPPPHPPRA